jgi:hypothetical protein
MKTYILLEYKRDITISKLGDKLVNAATRDQQQDIDTIITTLEQMDPTTNKQYVEWLARQYIKQQFRLEDYPRVNDVLVKFEQIKNKLQQRDINQYTFKSLEEVIDKEFNVELTDNNNSDISGAKNLYNGPLGRLDVPRTEEAAKLLGKGTKWCTAAEKNNMFSHYNEKGPLYVWRDKSGDKYQFHFKTRQFMDSRDKPIPHELLTYFRTKHPVLLKMFRKEEQVIVTDAECAYNYARDVIKSKWVEGETIIATNPTYAYLYARDIIKGEFPKGEKIIATDPKWAAYYALDVINDKWVEAEPIIATDPGCAYVYAQYVIKDEWKEGEPVIATDPECAYKYARDIIKDEWKEGEPIIATNPEYAYRYAFDIIGGRWIKGEKIIATNPYYDKLYKQLIASKKEVKK